VTFRTRLLLLFTVALGASVGLVEWLVTDRTREAFEQLESRRVKALVLQFQKEFERSGREILRAVDGIAGSDAALNIAISPDYAQYYGEAAALAKAHALDVLELVAADGTIVSSAEWPARFGYREDWLANGQWTGHEAFLRSAELPDGLALALVAVATVTAGDRKLFVTGGRKLDQEFLSSLGLPAGMRVLLYGSREAQFLPADLIGGPAGNLRPLIEQVQKQRTEATTVIGRGAEAETFHALPLAGPEHNLPAVLLVGSSRKELVELEASLRRIGLLMAASGIIVGLALGWWATARVTRPVRALAQSAGRVARGDWGTTVDSVSGDEIGQLARAFNRMTRELVDQRERLVQAERVAAWRELARRLAHELKNPLFPLQITVENMQRARERYPEQFDEVFREGAATLLAELANLKQIIARFSDFAKMPAPQVEPVQLNRLAQENLKLFDAQFAKAGIQARAELDPKLPVVQADPEQMARVLRNLILNAIDAMPQGGVLTVLTAVVGTGARLEVSDTGQGLTPEECERLFTPYYTTKMHGTGLGLAIVQSVVSDHKGRISVESQKGRGTTFRIELG